MMRRMGFLLIVGIICGARMLSAQEDVLFDDEPTATEPATTESTATESATDEDILSDIDLIVKEDMLSDAEPVADRVIFYDSELIADEDIPFSMHDNEYYRESLRLTKLAHDTYDYGDYDTAAAFAEEALRYAQLADEDIFRQLNRGTADVPATNVPAAARLPAQYTVRTWDDFRDCLWNIAGRSWVYGDPEMWRELYNANRSRMPEPDNPNLLEPGMVLIIPSIRGETREGMWEAGRVYP